MGTIVVTGAAGFIGWKTAQKLLEEGNQVIGIDNMNDYYDVTLKKHRLESLKKHKNFSFHQIDIESLKELDSIFHSNKIDAVINLAARAGVRYSLENPHVYVSTNTQGTLNLLELMRKYNIKKMVLASTSSLYAGQKMPFSEDLPVNTPISPYAASKKAAEAMAYAYHYLFELDISVLRYFTVYGPAGRPDMSIFRFIKWIDEGKPMELFGDGSQSRDFTYIDDIANGTIRALKEVGYEIINLGGGREPRSLNYVINKLEEYLGKKAIIEYKPFHKADMMETSAAVTKAGRLLDWEPKTGLDEGLRSTVDWYLANKSWLKDVKL
ncbi:MAG: SDR family NAD(P)-dependent oxidoreductase [Nitrospirae bacterium]|nr:SDR family NAD(P)-dependent oxidoreductase [Nitrospirota bacterium]